MISSIILLSIFEVGNSDEVIMLLKLKGEGNLNPAEIGY